MSTAERSTPTRPQVDWKGWVALAWALGIGLLYARMVLQERAPDTLRAIGRLAATAWGRG